MIPRVQEATYIRAFVIRISFTDGVKGEVNLEDDLEGEIFEPLRDVSYFRRFIVHNELHTVTWPNGADFAPEYLYQRVKAAA